MKLVSLLHSKCQKGGTKDFTHVVNAFINSVEASMPRGMSSPIDIWKERVQEFEQQVVYVKGTLLGSESSGRKRIKEMQLVKAGTVP